MSLVFDNTPPDNSLWPRYQRCLYTQNLEAPATLTDRGFSTSDGR